MEPASSMMHSQGLSNKSISRAQSTQSLALAPICLRFILTFSSHPLLARLFHVGLLNILAICPAHLNLPYLIHMVGERYKLFAQVFA